MITIESLMEMADAYAAAPQYFPLSDTTTNRRKTREALRAALTGALAKRETSDFQKWSVLAFRALDDAGRVLMTVEPECSTESDNLSVLTETIKELMYQALTLNGVLSRKDMDRKFHFGKLDSDALLAAQPVREPLTDAEISEIVEYLPESSDEQIQDDPVKFIRNLIRSIERAHGIGGER
jgi:hypothetical protein